MKSDLCILLPNFKYSQLLAHIAEEISSQQLDRRQPKILPVRKASILDPRRIPGGGSAGGGGGGALAKGGGGQMAPGMAASGRVSWSMERAVREVVERQRGEAQRLLEVGDKESVI